MFSNKFQPQNKTALIVGASQGLGAEIAHQLYKRHCNVVLVARTESKLAEQVTLIKQRNKLSSSSAMHFACDVSDYSKCEKLWEDLASKNIDPDFIFCCAGSSIPKLFGDLNGKDFTQGISTNYLTALNVVHTGFKSKFPNQVVYEGNKPRHIILFSSVVGFFPFIGYCQYGPMKAAISTLSIILRQELGPFGYRISCVFPGNFQSEGFDEEQKTKPSITKDIEGPSVPLPADVCANIIFSQLSRGYDTVTTDTVGWLLGCSVLGMLPRSWGLLQVIISFFISIIAPIANWFIYRDTVKFFKRKSNKHV